jgi:hypothetical protein
MLSVSSDVFLVLAAVFVSDEHQEHAYVTSTGTAAKEVRAARALRECEEELGEGETRVCVSCSGLGRGEKAAN